jgi:hypothetical protein
MTEEVHIVVGSSGDYSERAVWVAGVFTDRDEAVKAAQQQTMEDRANQTIWQAWSDELMRRGKAAGAKWDPRRMSFGDKDRATTAADLGMPPEPPYGNSESDHTVVTVPLNQCGKWGQL